jgi:hypothetical protein
MNIRYVSTTEGFNGHRFCEDGHSFEDQWYSDDVFPWNLQYLNSSGQVSVDSLATKFMALPADAQLNGFANALSEGTPGNGSEHVISKG